MLEMTMDREKSTDDCIGDLDKKVDVGFAKVDERFKAVDERFAKVDERFNAVDKQFEKVDERFEKVEGKIESGVNELRGEMNAGFARIGGDLMALHRLLLRASLGGFVAVCALLLGRLTGHI
jgi:predicted nuclease with TOPRIM domain